MDKRAKIFVTGHRGMVGSAIVRLLRTEGYDNLLLSKPDGAPRKLADASRIHALGWRHPIGLEEGITATYRWYLETTGRHPAK